MNQQAVTTPCHNGSRFARRPPRQGVADGLRTGPRRGVSATQTSRFASDQLMDDCMCRVVRDVLYARTAATETDDNTPHM